MALYIIRTKKENKINQTQGETEEY